MLTCLLRFALVVALAMTMGVTSAPMAQGLGPVNAQGNGVGNGNGHGNGQGQGAGQGDERRRGDAPRVPEDAPPPDMFANAAPAGDYRIDSLLSPYQWPGTWTSVTYSFYEDSVFGGAYYGSETVSEVSEPVKTNVRAIMALLSTMMDITFVEVTETSNTIGYIRFMRSTAPGYAYAYYPATTGMFATSGDVHLNLNYDRLGDTNGFQHPAGQHGYVSHP